jgi:hypothetical protein
MAAHRARLIEVHRARFGEHIPHIRREDVKGFLKRKPVWRVRPLGYQCGPKPSGGDGVGDEAVLRTRSRGPSRPWRRSSRRRLPRGRAG